MKYTTEQLQRFVTELQESDIELSKWEADFVDSIAEQLAHRRHLSERQVDVLDRIYAEKTP